MSRFPAFLGCAPCKSLKCAPSNRISLKNQMCPLETMKLNKMFPFTHNETNLPCYAFFCMKNPQICSTNRFDSNVPPQCASRFDSNVPPQNMRWGLNYMLGEEINMEDQLKVLNYCSWFTFTQFILNLGTFVAKSPFSRLRALGGIFWPKFGGRRHQIIL